MPDTSRLSSGHTSLSATPTQAYFMKHRLFVALVVFVVVPFAIAFQVSGTPSAAKPSAVPVLAAQTSSSTSLRSMAQKRGVDIGAAVAVAPFQKDANYRELLAREFNVLVPENAFKFAYVHPTPEGYNFWEVDLLMAFAKEHDMKVRGHPLIWHDALPTWLDDGNFTRDELLEIMHKHIQTVVNRYRGQVFAWDVVNEALNRDGSLRDTIWLRTIGPEYIDLAFKWAHEADPDAKLFYGDYANEERGRKPDAMYNLVSNLQQRGVPIHGVSLQAHRWLSDPPDPEALIENMTRHKKLGLEVHFTEVDVQIQRGTGSMEKRLAEQADAYATLLQSCLVVKNCTAFVTWGITDRYTWVDELTGQEDAPLLFDESYRPKPAYHALKEVLSSES